MKKKDKLENIYELITKGLFKEALKALKSFEKKNRLNPRDKIRVSNFYEWIGERERAITVLGKTKSLQDLELATEDELYVQGALAFFLEEVGAKYVARRLYNNLKQIFKDKKYPVRVRNLDFYKNFAFHHLRNSFCEEALEQYRELYDQEFDETQKQLILLYQGACLDALGRYQEAVEICEQVIEQTEDSDIIQAFAYTDRGEYFFNQGRFKQAQESFNLADTIFANKPQNKDVGNMKFWSGALYVERQEWDKARSCLLEAAECFKSGGQTFNLIPVLYFLERIPGYEPPLEDQLLLRTYWGYCEWSFLAGKKLPQKLLAPLHPWIEARLPQVPEKDDCWVIENQKVMSGNYHSMVQVLGKTENKIVVLDLISGLFWQKGEKKILTELQAICLDGLLGAGRWGIHQWALCDFIYRQEFFDPTSGLNRLKSLLKELKKLGLNIQRDKNRYSLDIPGDTLILMSMGHQYEGAFHYLKSCLTEFQRQDVERIFNVKKSTARTWIQNWIDDNLVEASGSGKDISYKVIEDTEEESSLAA